MDLRIKQGATFSKSLEFLDSNGQPLDVSGWTFDGQIRKAYDSPDDICDFTFDFGSAENLVTMSIPAATTATIPVDPSVDYTLQPTLYCYDVRATKADSTVIALFQGTVFVIPMVTQ